MFQNDVTKNYELQDATAEILLMLAGAFLLGFLFCWALRKLRGDSDYPANKHYTRDHKTRFSPTDVSTTKEGSSNNLLKGAAGAAIGTAGAMSGSIASAGSSAKEMAGDASHKITDSGASLLDSAADTLNTAGDKLSDAGSSITDSVSSTMSTAGDKLTDVGTNITDTVASANDKLSDIGSGIKERVSNTADAVEDKLLVAGSSTTEAISDTTTPHDNFKKIEGIGPKIETVLYAAGINTYADLRASDTETLRAILDTAGSAFKMHDPETWPYQADLAYNEKWDKLKEYQDFLMGSED